jgi:hypothetical protein
MKIELDILTIMNGEVDKIAVIECRLPWRDDDVAGNPNHEVRGSVAQIEP